MAGEAWIDDSLGAILGNLKNLELMITRWWFAPDHGRDGKASVFTVVLRVPMIMRWPKEIGKDRYVKNLYRTLILYPHSLSWQSSKTNSCQLMDRVSFLF